MEFMWKTQNKHESYWCGPGKITDLSDLHEGIITVKWQGRAMPCRTSDVRRALFTQLLYLAFDRAGSTHTNAYVEIVEFANSCNRSHVRLGWCVDPSRQWTLSKATYQYEDLWRAVQHASLVMGIRHCHGARIGCGMHNVHGPPEMKQSLLLWWYKHSADRYYTTLPASSAIDWRRFSHQDEMPEAYWWKIAFCQAFYDVNVNNDDDDHNDVPMLPSPLQPRPADLPDALHAPSRTSQSTPSEDDEQARLRKKASRTATISRDLTSGTPSTTRRMCRSKGRLNTNRQPQPRS